MRRGHYLERTGVMVSRNSLGRAMVMLPPPTRITPRCFQSLRMRLTLSREAPMLRAISSWVIAVRCADRQEQADRAFLPNREGIE